MSLLSISSCLSMQCRHSWLANKCGYPTGAWRWPLISFETMVGRVWFVSTLSSMRWGLCFIWAPLKSSWPALRATFFMTFNPWWLLLHWSSCLHLSWFSFSQGTLKPMSLLPSYWLLASLFTNQKQTWGQGHIVTKSLVTWLYLQTLLSLGQPGEESVLPLE